MKPGRWKHPASVWIFSTLRVFESLHIVPYGRCFICYFNWITITAFAEATLMFAETNDIEGFTQEISELLEGFLKQM